jgi:hypothetical protein
VLQFDVEVGRLLGRLAALLALVPSISVQGGAW